MFSLGSSHSLGRFLSGGLVAAAVAVAGCGGGVSGPNTVPIVASSGAPGINYVNGVFTTVTVCVPGSSTCQNIDNVLVDTGSMGLRLLSASVGGALTLSLPQQNDARGAAIVECSGFVDGFTWGPVQLADLTLGGETARALPIQVIGDPDFPSVPSSCSSSGGVNYPNEDSLQGLAANGIIGVGLYPQDCGAGCAESPTAPGTMNPGNVYYTCNGGTCLSAAVSVAAQVQNPVSQFEVDNNGVIIELPAIPESGAPSVNGTLVFGVGTRANNALGGATVIEADPETLSFTTVYNGKSYPSSYIDSGSNGIFFLSPALTGIPLCTDAEAADFYCPANLGANGTLAETATNVATTGSGARSTVNFNVANTDLLYGNAADFVFPDLAGPSGTGAATTMNYFGWGLSFFFGRNVYSTIEGSNVTGGTPPYFAY